MEIPMCSQCGNTIETLALYNDGTGFHYWCHTCLMKQGLINPTVNMIPSSDDDDDDPTEYFDNLLETYEEK